MGAEEGGGGFEEEEEAEGGALVVVEGLGEGWVGAVEDVEGEAGFVGPEGAVEEELEESDGAGGEEYGPGEGFEWEFGGWHDRQVWGLGLVWGRVD